MRPIIAVLVLALMPLSAFGQPAALDVHGDPLPAGATARLGTCRLWHGANIGSVAVSPNSKIVATGGGHKSRPLGPQHTLSSQDGSIRLWDTTTGKQIRQLTSASHSMVYSLAFSPDGKFLAAGGSNEVTLWDVAAGTLVRRLGGHAGNVTFVAFSAQGGLLHSATSRETWAQGVQKADVRRWDGATGKLLKSWTDAIENKPETAPGKEIQVSLHISPDGKKLLKGFWTSPALDPNAKPADRPRLEDLRLFDAESGKQVGKFDGLLADTTHLAISADGKRFAVGGEKIYVGTLTDATPLVKIDEPAEALVLAPDGKWLASMQHQSVSLWDTATGKRLRKIQNIDHDRSWGALPLATDGRTLAIADGETVRLWNIATGAELLPRQGHNAPVTKLRFSGNGREIISGDSQNYWRWDAATGKAHGQMTQRELAAKPGGEKGRFSSDSRIVIQGSPAGARHGYSLIDATNGKKLGSGTMPDSWCKPDASADAGRVAWMREDGLIAVANFKGEIVREFGHSAPTISTWTWSHFLCFSPDGRYLLSSLAYGRMTQAAPRHFISLWDVATGKEVRRFPICRPDGSPAHLACAAFSSDGRTIAVGQLVENLNGQKGEPIVSLWEVISAQECRKLAGHRGSVLSVAFAPDDRALVSGSDDGTALCWNLLNDLSTKSGTAAELKTDRLQALWADLAGDASRAYDAIWLLSARPKQAVSLMQPHLRPAEAIPQEPIQKLIDDLERGSFVVRERAMQSLEKLGEKAIPALTKALAKQPSLELRRRAEVLQAKAEAYQQTPSKEALQSLRALAVLERIGTPEAMALLRSIAAGAAEARLTQEAQAALTRLQRRKMPP